MYAIVDIETTGGNTYDNRIIEIAIVLHDGKKITDQYETLINPGIPIPRFITALTGISGSMVDNAPCFEDVAGKIEEMIGNNVFIAHNVNFDYSFLRKEFADLGLPFNKKRLCTIRLSRKLIPGFPSYSLGKLCKQVGIEIVNQHRALGDAYATATLFSLLKERDTDGFIDYSVKKNSQDLTLPPYLPGKEFDKLPKKPGVYYFHDSKGKVIYVGKAVNIKQRVASHFALSSGTRKKTNFINEIHSVSAKECGNELVAFLLESEEIKLLWPKYNVSQKGPLVKYGIYEYKDQKEFSRLGILRTRKNFRPLVSFSTIGEARDFLTGMVREYELCPRLTGLQTSVGACFSHEQEECRGACAMKEAVSDYNERHANAVYSLSERNETFAIVEEGRNKGEKSVVLIENGIYKGFGFVSRKTSLEDLGSLRSFIKPSVETEVSRSLLYSYLRSSSSGRVIRFESDPVKPGAEMQDGLFAAIA